MWTNNSILLMKAAFKCNVLTPCVYENSIHPTDAFDNAGKTVSEDRYLCITPMI